jgi:hypothetical protein
MIENSYIFYQGNSRITGRPIVGILTGLSAASRNGKTGEMYQTYIFSDNGRHPLDNGPCNSCSLVALCVR